MRFWSMGIPAMVVFATACGGEERVPMTEETVERTPYERTVIAAETARGYEQPEVPAPVVPTQGGQTVGGPLTAAGELRSPRNGISPGSVVVSEYGPGTRLHVKIDGYRPDAELVVYVVQGNCADPVEASYTVEPTMRINSLGFATLEEQVPIRTRTLLDGEHSIRVAAPNGGGPRFAVACAELPRVTSTGSPQR